MNDTMPTSEVLNRAADLIEERGWAFGSGWPDSPSGKLCLEGGIQAAMGVSLGPGYRCPAYSAVVTYLNEAGAKRANALWLWNDSLPYYSETTGEIKPFEPDQFDDAARRVIEVLRACAVIEASRERETAEVSA